MWMRNSFSEKKVKFFIASMIQALETIHSSGLIHGDIKPDNLIFDSQGYLKIDNFLKAKELTTAHQEYKNGKISRVNMRS